MARLRVTRIPILPLHTVNAHLIQGEGGCVLVDAGLPGSEDRIGRALARLGLGWRDLKLIVVTHAHVDHAGGAAGVRARSGARVVAHAAEREHLAGRAPMTFCPTGWFGRLFVRAPLIHQCYPNPEPDLLLSGDEVLDLSPYGVAGRVRPTPGHTPGSLSVELESRDALVGDLLASGVLLGGVARTGRAIRPPFEADPGAVGAQLERLVGAGFQTFHLGHGGPLGASEVLRHARALASAPRGAAHLQRAAGRGQPQAGT